MINITVCKQIINITHCVKKWFILLPVYKQTINITTCVQKNY